MIRVKQIKMIMMIMMIMIIMIFNHELCVLCLVSAFMLIFHTKTWKVFSFCWAAIPLSEDHKPNRTDERRRIENAGGVVMWAGKVLIIVLLMMLRTDIPVGYLVYWQMTSTNLK